MKDVVIDPPCFVGLVASAIEAYNRETNGFLLGRAGHRKIRRTSRGVAVLEAAYPIQTEDRKPNSVGHGNLKAFKRARSAVKSVRVGLDLMGGYHSHTGSNGAALLSSDDIDYIEGELSFLYRDLPRRERNWLEVVLTIRQKEYTRPHRPSWSLRRYGRKVGATVALGPHAGYDLTLAAFEVHAEPDGHPGRYEVTGSREAQIHIPWSRRF